MAEELFDSLNTLTGLNYIVADSAEDLRKQLLAIHMPVSTLGFYAVGSKHVAWFLTSAKIKKVEKKSEVKNGKRNR